MLVKETGERDLSINFLNCVNSDSTIRKEVSDVTCVPNPQTKTVIESDGRTIDRESEKQFVRGSPIPLDYQLLPKEFFDFDDVPPPLVSKTWLMLLCDKNKTQINFNAIDSDEDSLPLAKLITKLRKTKRKKHKDMANSTKLPQAKQTKTINSSQINAERKKKQKKSPDKCSLINRKRGRPRKTDNQQLESNNQNNFLNNMSDTSQDDNFWNDQSDCSIADDQVHERVTDESMKNDNTMISYNEHDYFKPGEVTLAEKSENDMNKTKKKTKIGVLGVKTDDFKISFSCLECGKSFSGASTLKNHKRIHDGTLLKCTECSRGFTTKYLLKCHMRIHNGDLFMCHKCGKGFTTAELLKVHSRGHTGDRPFACNICGRSFPSASNLSQHKQTHDSEKKFLCFQCGSSFSQKRCLDGHMLTHAEKNHICNVCGKLWARKSDLIEHMRVHTGVKPYCCSICPQKFTQASSLKRHQILHMDVKPIHCLACNKIFKCQEYYKRHMRKHEKEADYFFSSTVKDK